MARLSSQANLGFVALPTAAMPMIASYIAAPHKARVLDPCAGEGVALRDLCQALGIEKRLRYANELHDTRAAACETVASHVLLCDAVKSLQSSRGLFQVAYINPPFDHDGQEEGGGRLEAKFFRRAVEDGRWVQPGGLVVLVSPQDVLARREICNHLARCYTDIRIVALPATIRHYREAVVFGVVRETFLRGKAYQQESQRLFAQFTQDLPPLTMQDQPCYTLPVPVPIKKVVWRDGSKGTPALAQQDVLHTGGAWNSRAYRDAKQRLQPRQLAPLFPLQKTQAALRIANGAINGMEIEFAGQRQRIKGSTVEQHLLWTEEEDTETRYVVSRHKLTRMVPHVTTIDDAGTIRQFIGDEGMATLMAHPGAASALLDAVEQSAPPRYRLDMEPRVADCLARIQPMSGRALPGYDPGLLPMQQHVVAALFRHLTTPDPEWDDTIPFGTIAAMEMGCGKTTAALAIAELLRCLAPTNR